MNTFETFENDLAEAAQKMIGQNIPEIAINTMVLVKHDSPEEVAHESKGATRMSVHEFGGQRFILFSS